MDSHLNNKEMKGKRFFYGLLGATTIATAIVFAPFFAAITLAFITSLIFQPVYRKFLAWTKNHTKISISMTIMFIMLILLLPLSIVTHVTLQQIFQFYFDIRSLSQGHDLTLNSAIERVNELIELLPFIENKLTLLEAQNFINNTIAQATRHLINFTVKTGANSINLFAQFFVYLFLLYFLIPIQDKIPSYIAKISPLENKTDMMLITSVEEMTKSMIKGTLVISVVQGLAGGLVLGLFGTPYLIFWTMLMIFLGILPIVGPSTILLPAGILFILLGDVWQGITILLTTIIFVSNIDNVLRPLLVSREAELHPGYILISVLGGIHVFGVLGVIYGPVIFILFYNLLKVYQHTYRK